MVKPVSADCCGAYLCDGVFVVNTGGILRDNPIRSNLLAVSWIVWFVPYSQHMNVTWASEIHKTVCVRKLTRKRKTEHVHK